MKAITLHLAAALALTFAIAACVPAAKAPTSAPPSPTRPAAVPAPALPRPSIMPAPQADGWMDAAATAGTWRYQPSAAGGAALFVALRGERLATIECSVGREVAVAVFGAGQGPITIRTETASQTRVASRSGMALRTLFAPNDPLLDAMALSKGRFAVEVAGQPPLYLPSHAELSRVIEDCR